MNYNYLIPKFLAQGSAPEKGPIKNFDVLVLTAKEYQPANIFGISTIYAPLNDDGTPITKEECKLAFLASAEVTKRLKNGQRVLTTCWQGFNRSGLINGLTLIQFGFTYDKTLELIKRVRGNNALSNPYFRRVLRYAANRRNARGTRVESRV